MQAAHSFNQKFILSTIINLPLAPTFSSFSKEGLQQKCFSKKFPKVKIYYLAELPLCFFFKQSNKRKTHLYLRKFRVTLT